MRTDRFMTWIVAPIACWVAVIGLGFVALNHSLLLFRVGYIVTSAVGLWIVFDRYRNWQEMQRFDEIVLVLGLGCMCADVLGVV